MGEFRTTRGEPLPLTSAERRSRAVRILTVLTLVLAAVIGAGFLVRLDRRVIASGYVTTEEYAEVRAPVAGLVSEIAVRTGAQVKAGDLLVRFESREEQAALQEAKNQIKKIEAESARVEATIVQEKRNLADSVARVRLELQHATALVARTRELVAKGLAPASALEEEQLKENLCRGDLSALLGKTQEVLTCELEILRQDLAASRDAAARTQARLEAREVRAPIAGQVLRYEFVVGQLVHPENVMYEIFGGNKLVLKARVPERYATRVQSGNAYRARLASYRGLQRIWFRGLVNQLRDVIQSDGPVNYRVAYCDFDARQYPVPPGTTAEVFIYCGKVNFWSFLFGLE